MAYVIPQFVREGFNSALALPIKMYKMADGDSRSLRNYAQQPRNFKITWRLNWKKFKLFEAWALYDVIQLTGYFNLVIYPGQPANNVRFIPNEDGVPYSVQFNESINVWEVTATFECIIAAPVIPATPVDFPAWPETLPPLPEKAGYSIMTNMQLLRDMLDEGYAAQRQRNELRFSTIPVTWYIDEPQRVILEDFYINDLAIGVFSFKMKLANGMGETEVVCKFVELPTVQPNGSMYTVTAKIFTSQLPIMTETDYRNAI